MIRLTRLTLLVAYAGFATIAIGAFNETANAAGAQERITANAVSLDPDDPDYYKSFAPELPKTLARVPQIDPGTGLYVEEIKPNLFYVTEGIYQSAFLATGNGVIVFDAPPSYAHKLPDAINKHAPNQAIKYLVYSHGHADHIGGANAFENIEGLRVVAQKQVAESIKEEGHPNILLATNTFKKKRKITLGGETVELRSASFHSEDADAIIYLPRQKFVMAVDTITPGEAPFMNFGATADIGEYLKFFDGILEYDFDFILSGHVSILGNRDDVLEAKDYAFDVRDSALNGMKTFLERFNATFETFEYENPNLAYRVAIESVRQECSTKIIERWKDRLSVVDVWADSHCQAVILYYIMH